MPLNIFLRLILVWIVSIMYATGRVMEAPGLQLSLNGSILASHPNDERLFHNNLTLLNELQPALVNLDQMIQKTIEIAQGDYQSARLRSVVAKNILRYTDSPRRGERPILKIEILALVKQRQGPDCYTSLVYEVDGVNSPSPRYQFTDFAKHKKIRESQKRVFEYNSATVPMNLLEAGDLLKKEIAFDQAEAILRIPLAFDSSSQIKPYWLISPITKRYYGDYYVIDMQAEAGRGAVVAKIPGAEAYPDPTDP